MNSATTTGMRAAPLFSFVAVAVLRTISAVGQTP